MPSVPSLRIWVCSFVVVCILFGAFGLLAPDPVLLTLNYKRLAGNTHEENRSDDKKHIVCMGSSILRHAMYYDDGMEAAAKQNGYNNVLFTRFTPAI